MPGFAANLSLMFTEHPLLDRFAAAADAGFDAVELQFPYEHSPDAIAGRLAASGLELTLFNLSPGDWAAGDRGLAALPHRREQFRVSVAQALAYAEATGTRKLHAMAGIARSPDTGAAAAYRDALRYACDEAGARGIEVMIEPINPRDMPGYFLSDFAAAAELIRELALPNLKLQFDVYHRQILHGDVLKGLEALLPITGHVQIASVPGRNEPGTGELDDFRIFRALDELGYAGRVGCEYRPLGRTEDGLGWRREIA